MNNFILILALLILTFSGCSLKTKKLTFWISNSDEFIIRIDSICYKVLNLEPSLDPKLPSETELQRIICPNGERIK